MDNRPVWANMLVMKAMPQFHNRLVAALVLVLAFCQPSWGQTAKLDALFLRLQDPSAEDFDRVTQEIWIEWSKSGSPSVDLLFQRGQQAMAMGDVATAIEHFTAVIDHAPDFAEGWNRRATAYFQIGDFGPSVSDISHVLSLNPRHFGALAGLGMIFEQLDRPEKALEVYKAALAINPHLTDTAAAITRLEQSLAGQDL